MIISKLRKSFSNLFRMDSILENKMRLSLLRERNLSSKEMGIEQQLYIDKPVVVSLTTYGKKIHEVYLVIESIFQQTVQANKVVLWLSDKDFSLSSIPQTLKNQVRRGLDIRFCKDIRSYTKVVYAFQEFQGCHIISIDDDIVYPFDMIERFIRSYEKDHSKIYFNKGHKMIYDKKKDKMRPYIEWVQKSNIKGSSLYYLPLGVYGIFYPEGILNKDVLNQELFLKLCPTADDIWFKAMSMLEGIECEVVQPGSVNVNDFISIELNRERSLARINVDEKANDFQIQKVFEYYNIFKFFNHEKSC